jgi:hypothetical protein
MVLDIQAFHIEQEFDLLTITGPTGEKMEMSGDLFNNTGDASITGSFMVTRTGSFEVYGDEHEYILPAGSTIQFESDSSVDLPGFHLCARGERPPPPPASRFPPPTVGASGVCSLASPAPSAPQSLMPRASPCRNAVAATAVAATATAAVAATAAAAAATSDIRHIEPGMGRNAGLRCGRFISASARWDDRTVFQAAYADRHDTLRPSLAGEYPLFGLRYCGSRLVGVLFFFDVCLWSSHLTV